MRMNLHSYYYYKLCDQTSLKIYVPEVHAKAIERDNGITAFHVVTNVNLLPTTSLGHVTHVFSTLHGAWMQTVLVRDVPRKNSAAANYVP
jgi:hypothetical protein